MSESDDVATDHPAVSCVALDYQQGASSFIPMSGGKAWRVPPAGNGNGDAAFGLPRAHAPRPRAGYTMIEDDGETNAVLPCLDHRSLPCARLWA